MIHKIQWGRIMKKIYFTLIAFWQASICFSKVGLLIIVASCTRVPHRDFLRLLPMERPRETTRRHERLIDLVWLPQSGKCIETTKVMGYKPYYYFNQNSSFGTEAELRSLIAKFKANGIGAIADVVVVVAIQTAGMPSLQKPTRE